MRILTETNSTLLNVSLLLLRGMVGVVLFPAGAGKVFGWFGGFGIEKTLGFYAMMSFSAPLAYLSMFTEFIGGFLLMVGLFTRPVAVAVAINMLVAFIVTIPKGFLIGMAAFPFSLMLAAIIIFLTGPMAYSVDAIFIQPGEVIRNRREESSQLAGRADWTKGNI